MTKTNKKQKTERNQWKSPGICNSEFLTEPGSEFSVENKTLCTQPKEQVAGMRGLALVLLKIGHTVKDIEAQINHQK